MGAATAGLIMGGVGLVGSVASAVSTVNAAGDQKDAIERQAYLKRLQADELMNREMLNEDIMREQGELAIDEYQASSFGPGIGTALRMRSSLAKNIATSRREADFKASQLRAGADIDMDLASSQMTASYYNAAGSILQGGYKAYGIGKAAGLFKGED